MTQTAKELADWFSAFQRQCAAVRQRFVPESPETNIKRLSQTKVRKQLTVATDTFWSQSDADRTTLRPAFFSLLCTLKLIADDVFVETIETVRNKDRAAELKARNAYRDTIVDFVRANPFVFATSAARSAKQLYVVPPPTPRLAFAFTERLSTFSIQNQDFLIGELISSVSDLQNKLAGSTSGTAKDIAVPDGALQFVGMLFLILQMYLADLKDVAGPPTFPGDVWYASANPAVEVLRTEVLGFFWTVERSARDAGNDAVADALKDMGTKHIDRLARLFSLRVEETTAAWAFRHRRVVKAKGETFGAERFLFGANDVKLILMSYLGRPNPDGANDLAAIDVETLVGDPTKYEDTDVNVIGEVDAARAQLLATTSTASVDVDFASGELQAAESLDVAVEIDGTFEKKTHHLVAKQLKRFAEAYYTPVGFPLAVTDVGREVPLAVGPSPAPPRLDLQPGWRTETIALQHEAQREERDRVPASLVGQQRLLRDLLAFAEVRKALGKRAKTLETTDLHDHDLRGQIWKVVFAALEKTASDTALDRLLELLQRYLTHYTRHTLWNVHDDNPAYFKEPKWAITIAGRRLYDCGVYDVIVAFDLQRAIEGSSKKLRFGFITFLNHITLTIFDRDRSFFVNNDVIHGPRAMTKDDDKDDAARAEYAIREWAPLGFPNVYGVDFSIAFVRVPQRTIMSTLGKAFPKTLWSFYKDTAVWWGLKPGIAGTYHRLIYEYDTTMHALGDLVAKTNAAAQASSSDVLAASKLAKRLFDVARLLADVKNNFGERRKITHKVKEVSAMAVFSPVSVEPPLYVLVRRLAAAKKRGDTLTPEQDALTNQPTTAADHATLLTP